MQGYSEIAALGLGMAAGLGLAWTTARRALKARSQLSSDVGWAGCDQRDSPDGTDRASDSGASSSWYIQQALRRVIDRTV